MTASTALTVAGVSVTFGKKRVIDDLSFTLEAGETLAIAGPSGVGKTSLLSAILGQVPYRGLIEVAGKPVTSASASAIRRDHLGVVFQHAELLEELSPMENVALGALIIGMSHAEANREAAAWLDRLGVPNAPTSDTLSGGERQRVALARALIKKPSLILADEPTGALDADTRDQVAALLFKTAAEHGCALLLVTHDDTVAQRAQRQLRIGSRAGTPPSASAGLNPAM